MGEFTMPSLGADMDRGILSEWLVAEGEQVRKGDIVAVIQTDKSDVEVEIFESGVVEALLVEPGTEVEVGAPLARIGNGEGEPQPEATPEPKTKTKPKGKGRAKPKTEPSATTETTPESKAPPAPVAPEPVVTAGAGRRHASVVLSPLVRHLADELHVDTTSIEGSGPGGKITRADIEAAAAAPTTRSRPGASPYARRQAEALGTDLTTVTGTGPGGAVLARDVTVDAPPSHPVPAPSETRPTRTAAPVDRQQAMRSAIARLMTTSNRDIPHYHVVSQVDLHDALVWLDHHNASVTPGQRILPAAMLLRATAVAATAVPELNGWWRDDAFAPASSVDIGVAVSLRGGGLVTPTIAAVDQMDLVATMAALRDLVTRARRGRLRGGDLIEASITVTNLGEQGAEAVLGLIHPPQVALVGFGRVVDQVCAVDEMVAIRPQVTATLSGDHRATDGHAGSQFLAALTAALAHPDQL